MPASLFRRSAGFGVALLAACVLAACQPKTASLEGDQLTTSSTGKPAGPSFKRTEALGKSWTADQANVATGVAYAESLGALGQRDTQISVLKTIADKNPGNAEIQADMGKRVLAMGEGAVAIDILERAAAQNPGDWRTLSALGTAYDQQGRHGPAREKYEAALAAKPGELSVMNNLGMSLALQGKLPEAERTFRDAISKPGAAAIPRIRQNLALVVGLQGRFDEAEQIASKDLPPDQVRENMAYLQQMLQRPNTWAQLQDGETSTN